MMDGAGPCPAALHQTPAPAGLCTSPGCERTYASTGPSLVTSVRRNFSPELSAPLLGLPTATDAEILRLQNTSSWAFDPFYRTSVNGSAVRGSGYNDPTEVRWGTGSYN
eukprot:scaffold47896_cov65-Phaeocystis_antarctica.AAC.1